MHRGRANSESGKKWPSERKSELNVTLSALRESPIHLQTSDLTKRLGEGASAALVEDGEAERHTLTAFLQHMGFAVTAVSSGLAYYQELASRAFTIAVIDMGLPDQAGEILVEYTRRNTASGIVVVTAQDRVEARIDAFQAGAVLELTTMEFKLLSLLMTQNGTVTRAHLLAELYQSENSSAERALETLIHRTRHRISAETLLRPPILTHHGVGYFFAGQIARH